MEEEENQMEVGLVSDMIHVLVRHHYGLEREQEDELAYVVVGLDMDSCKWFLK